MVGTESKREMAVERSLFLEQWSRFSRNWISGVRFFLFLFLMLVAVLLVFMATAVAVLP